MKRKLLLEFADWLEKSRKPFNIGAADKCISFQACRFNGEVKGDLIVAGKQRPRRCSDSRDLARIFDMPGDQAQMIYSGFCWDDIGSITRKVAAKMLRHFARTGTVNWNKALKA